MAEGEWVEREPLFVVEFGGSLFGTFPSREYADEWASSYVGGGTGSWTVRHLADPVTGR